MRVSKLIMALTISALGNVVLAFDTNKERDENLSQQKQEQEREPELEPIQEQVQVQVQEPTQNQIQNQIQETNENEQLERQPAATRNREAQKELSKKARFRLYPGGMDEENLKVQARLPGPGKRTIFQDQKSAVESD